MKLFGYISGEYAKTSLRKLNAVVIVGLGTESKSLQ